MAPHGRYPDINGVSNDEAMNRICAYADGLVKRLEALRDSRFGTKKREVKARDIHAALSFVMRVSQSAYMYGTDR